jgi:hypothetical protein
MAMLGKGLKAIAKQEFEKKVRRIVVMNSTEKARTLVVGRKNKAEVVDGVPLSVIREVATANRYDVRAEYALDGLVGKLYLMKPKKEVVG